MSFHGPFGFGNGLANTSGSLTARNDYDAFGLQSSSNQSANTIGYTGQRLDGETGLMALGNGERYYSPAYARFIQQDSWTGNNQMPQTMNRFSYGLNNPLKYVDPSGNAPQDTGKSDSWNFWYNLSNSDSYLANAAGFTGLFFYEVGDMLTFGGVSRQDPTMTEYSRGEISGSEMLWRTAANIAVSAPLLVAGLMTGGASTYIQVGVGAIAAGIQRFGTDNYEISFEGRKSFSSAGQYALDIALGAAGGAIGGLAMKYGGQIANYLGRKVTTWAKQGTEIAKKGLGSLTKGAQKAADSVSEALTKIGSSLDEMFSPQMATPDGLTMPMSQIDDVGRNRTTMLSEALDDAPLVGGSSGGGSSKESVYKISEKLNIIARETHNILKVPRKDPRTGLAKSDSEKHFNQVGHNERND